MRRTAFGDGGQTLPPLQGPTRYVGLDLYAIQKDDSGASLVLDESPNPVLPESHCDVAYSLGLARVAGSSLFEERLPNARFTKPRGW